MIVKEKVIEECVIEVKQWRINTEDKMKGKGDTSRLVKILVELA